MSNFDSQPLTKLSPTDAWAPWQATDKDPFDARWVSHLYRRAGFGCTPREMREAVQAGLDATLERMLSPPKSPFMGLAPITNPAVPAAAMQIRAEWLQRMLSGAEPLRERLTFFWHNHFATSIAKIQDARLMERQIELIRKHALGKFGPFLKEMSREPAMLIWLDSNQNVKAHPNENYAREIMELFALGVGNYTEKDVQEAARAFTGWQVSGPNDGARQFKFVTAEHDFGRKVVLKQEGDWDGDDVIRILLEQPACARFLVRKLYRFFINENVQAPDALIQPLADQLKKSDYELLDLVKTILKSRLFFSAHAYRRNVKGPIDYSVGVSRLLCAGATGSVVVSPYSLINTLELQGQQLYQPPNVKGWEGGKAWLNTATVLARHNFSAAMANGMKDLNAEALRITGATFAVSPDPLPRILHAVRQEHKIDPDDLPESTQVISYLGGLLLPGDLPTRVAQKLVAYIEKGKSVRRDFEQRCRDALHALMTLPEYQLS
jgi:uncharacterized protein (DUF1800 family)